MKMFQCETGRVVYLCVNTTYNATSSDTVQNACTVARDALRNPQGTERREKSINEHYSRRGAHKTKAAPVPILSPPCTLALLPPQTSVLITASQATVSCPDMPKLSRRQWERLNLAPFLFVRLVS